MLCIGRKELGDVFIFFYFIEKFLDFFFGLFMVNMWLSVNRVIVMVRFVKEVGLFILMIFYVWKLSYDVLDYIKGKVLCYDDIVNYEFICILNCDFLYV